MFGNRFSKPQQQSQQSEEQQSKEESPGDQPPQRENEEHHYEQFKRFRADGHAPPVPPVGGQSHFSTTSAFNKGSTQIVRGADSPGDVKVSHDKNIESKQFCQQPDFSIY